MKRTCTVLLQGPDPLILGTFHGPARKTRSGPVFLSNRAELIATETVPDLEPARYIAATRKHSTPEYPPIEFQA